MVSHTRNSLLLLLLLVLCASACGTLTPWPIYNPFQPPTPAPFTCPEPLLLAWPGLCD